MNPVVSATAPEGARAAEMAERANITDVLVRYCRAIDTKDWVLFASCFTTDCVTRYQGRAFDGVGRLTDVMRRLHDPLDASLHRLTNVEISLSSGAALVRSYVDALLVRTGHPEGPLYHVAGFYMDELHRVNQVWRIHSRVFEPVWISERASSTVPSGESLGSLYRITPSPGRQDAER